MMGFLRNLLIIPCTFSTQAQQPNAAEERVTIDSTDTLTTRAQICGSTNVPAAEFHFMVKSGTGLLNASVLECFKYYLSNNRIFVQFSFLLQTA